MELPNIFIGTDIVEVDRINKLLLKSGELFKNKVFTTLEQKYCDSKSSPSIHYAGRFAAKESIIKAVKSSEYKNPIPFKNIEILPLNHNKYKTIITEQKTKETYSNLASLMQSFEIGRNKGDDLIFFVEDDYLHFEPMLEEMVTSYERLSSQIGKDIFMCPSDYPYLYMTNEKTNVLIGNKRHWRTLNKTLCTFMTSKNLLDKYWDNFSKTCQDRHDPFEKYINEIYEKEICISPIKSLSLHLTNVNSSYGLSPFIDFKKLWDQNN